MTYTDICKEKVMSGQELTKEEALTLYDQPLEELCRGADELREHFCADRFDFCAIINGKSGRCSENCRFCAQSTHNKNQTVCFPLLSAEDIVAQAKKFEKRGVKRYSIVTSGKRLSEKEVDRMCEAVRRIREETGLSVCVSFGLLDERQFRKLKEAGVTRVHNNLEASERYFPKVCSTHTFEEKQQAICAAQNAGLTVCSGGIMGIGETVEDRIDLALSLRELGIKSVPVNMLNPIPGTPLEHQPLLTEEEMRRIVAVCRFLLPDAAIRLAGGRGLLTDKGKSCFQSGANAAITGDMLTTAGITVETDLKLLKELGYAPALVEK